ncbi:hypothetical protein PR202_gb18249 [Eleusine coracana subsp. coracana]|uniref:Bax inhibitor 1 n=1 Tax=Eleusine coracana subsp. coracana TaxID=191504 RepID=A0AAV5F5R4_ELECO|nr:hypothetical protein PR202_gb18249 [Eleusine coracana subsp. coracana]
MESLFGFLDAQSQRRRRRTSSFESLKRLGHISPAVQSHLKHASVLDPVLCAGLLRARRLPSRPPQRRRRPHLGCMVSIAGLLALPAAESQQRNRFALLMSAAFLQGASIGPLAQLALHLDPRILVTAFIGTAIAFACFSAAAILAKRREYLYLGALLSSGLSILVWLQFAASIFGHSSSTFMFELYFGLLVFLGYMVFDTQEIIERAHHGDMDYIMHALTLFTDFVAVFVRVLIIMMKNASEKSEDERKRKKR